VLAVGDDDATIELEQAQAPRNQIAGGLFTLNFPTVSYARYLIPGYLYAQARLVTWVAGYAFRDRRDGGFGFVSEPLTEISIGAGSYAIPPDRRLRAYGGVFGGIRLVHSSQLFGLEPIAPAIAGVVLGVEIEPFAGIFGFFELAPTMLISTAPQLLAGAVADEHDFPIVPTASIGYLDPFRFSLGVRYRW
jgi:hypothetical protein